MVISCIAIDDEPIALGQIGDYIRQTPFLNLVASCKSAYEAMEVLSSQRIDLMFVDIQMPDLTGLDFVRILAEKPLVIFTTAHEQYAIDGFKVDAIDYLLKPLGYEEFLTSANRALFHYKLHHPENLPPLPAPGYIFVKSEYKLFKVFFSDILYIEGQKEYIKIAQNDQKCITTLLTLKKVEETLPKDQFIRVHRSFIVNINYVKSVEYGHIIFGKVKIPVSEQYKKDFYKFLDKHTVF